jgi:hypothetical protein
VGEVCFPVPTPRAFFKHSPSYINFYHISGAMIKRSNSYVNIRVHLPIERTND